MLTNTALVFFLISICMTRGSNYCPGICTCMAAGKELQCSGLHLELIPELQGTEINTLDISFNNISLIFPDDFNTTGRQLKYFYLNNNVIKDVDQSVFSKLPSLMHINLGYNLITRVDPNTFEDNNRLWKVILNGNALTLPEDSEILNLPSLGWIELENCNISHLPANVFQNVTKIVFIRLSNNRIEYLNLTLFSGLKQLRYLHLEGNQIKEIHPELFKSNHKLEWLYLNHNPLHESSAHHFLNAPSLILLDISFCNISHTRSSSFSNLHNLISLKLNNNILKSFNMTHIPKNLRVLDISGNSIKTIHITNDTIRYMADIKHMDLTDNEFICDCRLYDLWQLCANLRKGFGDVTSCGEFCPDSSFGTCKGRHHQMHETRSISGNLTENEGRESHEYTNTRNGEIDEDYDRRSNEQNIEVDIFDGGHNHSKDGNETSGKYRVNEESAWSEVGNIVLYTCIGTFAGFSLVGTTVLVAEVVFGGKKRRGKASANSRLRLVRMRKLETSEDRQEIAPLSQQHGFDFVHVPTNKTRTGHIAQS